MGNRPFSIIFAGVSAAVAAASLLAACGGNVNIEASSTGDTVTATSSSSSSSSVGGAGGSAGSGGQGGGSGGSGGCNDPPDVDKDGDGFTPAQGDCDDCNADVNPAAAEIPNYDAMLDMLFIDDDCDGQVDEPPPTCDYSLAIDSADPLDAARALDLCQVVSAGDPYGVISANWMQPDGTDPPAAKLDAFHLGHGILPDLGQNAPALSGGSLLALSDGVARKPTDPAFSAAFNKGYACAHPAGMPFNSPSCPPDITGEPHDGIALEIEIQPPNNAATFQFMFRFYTHEWPQYVCSKFNDQLAVLVSPLLNALPAGNIAYDQYNNPLTSSFLLPDACQCAPAGCPPQPPCEMNGPLLEGTGFGGSGAATPWLKSIWPFEKGIDKITLRFLLYDTGDGNVDTTVLFDSFRWFGELPDITGVPPV